MIRISQLPNCINARTLANSNAELLSLAFSFSLWYHSLNGLLPPEHRYGSGLLLYSTKLKRGLLRTSAPRKMLKACS